MPPFEPHYRERSSKRDACICRVPHSSPVLAGVFAGMIVGVATVILLMRSHRDPLYGWSAGFVACVSIS